MLVSCNDKKSYQSGSESEYKLKIDGIEANVVTGTEIKVTAEIMRGDKLVNEGGVATTAMSLAIKCADHQVADAREKRDRGQSNFRCNKGRGRPVHRQLQGSS